MNRWGLMGAQDSEGNVQYFESQQSFSAYGTRT